MVGRVKVYIQMWILYNFKIPTFILRIANGTVHDLQNFIQLLLLPQGVILHF